ncbi:MULTISPECIES: VWA domain-containing protein [Pandoraea]|uniref:vWA domain-containing protein n=1 Tax=Pandoraea TaxID=93217 RepID=UPI001F5CE393|nr:MULTISPECIES: VWA domain-containing protein [Pandoraea]MCI3208584.1 hypothetical protein [Pandoraea sp. LA3]MDN4586613.1 hypothetical protein [Pandoraea capi]
MFQFDYPWCFALLPLPLLLWWLLPPYREESPSVRLPFFGDVASAAGLQPAAGAVVPRRNWVQHVLAPIAWTLLIAALARPQMLEAPIEKVQPTRDILLALDLSQSMDTPDFPDHTGTRIPRVQAVRAVVGDFVTQRPDDRIGLVIFGDAAYPLAPFTLDHVLIHTLLDDMLPGMAGNSTALGDAIGLGAKMFERSEAPQKVMIVLTDGNDTASRLPPALAAGVAHDSGVIVHTVGIGDPAAQGEVRVDLDALQRIATRTGGRYFFGEDQTALKSIYDTLDRITPHDHKTLSWRPRRELFVWPLGAALLIVLLYEIVLAGYATYVNRKTVVPGLDEPSGARESAAAAVREAGGVR